MGEKKLLTRIDDISNWLDKNIWKEVTITIGTKSDVFRIMEACDPSDQIPSWKVVKEWAMRTTKIDIDKIDSIEVEQESEEE